MKRLISLTASIVIGVALTTFPTLAQSVYEPYTFTTLAGALWYRSVDGIGSAARFFYPQGITVSNDGNVFVADSLNHTIRKITPAGEVTTLAGRAGSIGNSDGIGSAARFQWPSGVAADGAGNLYVADTANHTIRKITPAGVVTTLAGLAGVPGYTDGLGGLARFYQPFGIAVDNGGNIYVADSKGNTIRKVTPLGEVSTLAGRPGSLGHTDGTGSTARFNNPSGVAVDNAGYLYVVDAGNNTIRKVTLNGEVTTLAGLAQRDGNGNYVRGSVDGAASTARFAYPAGVAVDNAGNLYVSDLGNETIRKVTPAGVVTTLAGLPLNFGSTDGTGNTARFNSPFGIAMNHAGLIYVADSFNHSIRRVTTEGVVTTLAGLPDDKGAGSADGVGTQARFDSPFGVAVNDAGMIYVADTFNHTIRKVAPAGVVTTFAGLPGNLGDADGTGSVARFYEPTGLAADNSGNLYVADQFNNTIRKVTPEGAVTTLAGQAGTLGGTDGMGNGARFFWPAGVAVDTADNVYVADSSNHTIRKITPAGAVTTLAGLAAKLGSADGAGGAARFYNPQGVAVDKGGNVYVADNGNHTIRKITPAGVVSTLAGLAGFYNRGSADGTGSAARFIHPSGLAVDAKGNVYVADSYNHTIRKVTLAGEVTTLGGLAGAGGNMDGTGSDVRFSTLQGLAVDAAGVLYVADTSNSAIRKGFLAVKIASSGLGFGFNGGKFGFNLTGPAGKSVVVEASTDFVNWLPLWTNTFAGALTFSDAQSGGVSNRFYRSRLP
ncbi:MAG: hypothetical protein HY043_12095 [Verrucomicrobia bacterium]|nr:hypothetical protein [Verrucomicrobiota bacterium]